MSNEEENTINPDATAADDLSKSQLQTIEVNRKRPSDELVSMIQDLGKFLCESEKFGEKYKEERT